MRSPARRSLLPIATLLACAMPAAAQDVAGVDPTYWDSPDGEPRSLELVLAPAGLAPADGARPLGGTSNALAGCDAPADDFLFTGSLPEGDTPTAARFTPDGSKILVAHRTSQDVFVFDASTRALIARIPVTGSPNDIAVSSDGVHVVTANIWEDTASILSLTTNTELAVLDIGDQPGVVRISPNGLTAVVGNTVSNELSVIDIATQNETNRIAGTGFVNVTTITGEGGVITTRFAGFEFVDDDTVLHADFWSDTLDFFDLTTGVETSVAVADAPRGLAITPDRTVAVVSHTGTVDQISVVNTATQAVVKTIPTGASLNEPIAIDPAATKAVASILNAAIVVDLVTNAISPSLNTASINGLHVTADGQHVLAIGFRGSLISFASQSVVKELNNIVNAYVGATAPVGDRGVLLAQHNGEDMLVVNTNGAAGFLEEATVSGLAPEADSTRKVAITDVGTRIVSTNILSHTASIVNFATGALEGVVDVGKRPSDVEITPDGSKAVVANLDSTFCSIIDLNTQAVTNVPISTRASEVEISPDGQYAYVAVVVNDGVWRIDLNTLSVAGPRLDAGNMGSVFYGFQQSSGMTLSHDGATLAVCGSFSSELTLIDTASWSVLTDVPVTGLSARALFADDDSEIYVSNRDADTVAIVSNAGAASAVIATVNVGNWPFEMATSLDGDTLYVSNFLDDTIGIVDLTTNLQTGTIAMPDSVQGLVRNSSGCLLAASGGWSVTLGPMAKVQISTNGAFSVIDTGTNSVVHQTLGTIPPAELRLDASQTVAVVPSPFGDGVTTLSFGTTATPYCTAGTTTNGCNALVSATGTARRSSASGFDVSVDAVEGAKQGIVFFGTSGPTTSTWGGGTSVLCVKAPVTRTGVQASGGTAGACDGAFTLDFNAWMTANPLKAPVAGSCVHMQGWFRDPPAAKTTNLSNGLEFTVLP